MFTILAFILAATIILAAIAIGLAFYAVEEYEGDGLKDYFSIQYKAFRKLAPFAKHSKLGPSIVITMFYLFFLGVGLGNVGVLLALNIGVFAVLIILYSMLLIAYFWDKETSILYPDNDEDERFN